jgi:hypothetical protein
VGIGRRLHCLKDKAAGAWSWCFTSIHCQSYNFMELFLRSTHLPGAVFRHRNKFILDFPTLGSFSRETDVMSLFFFMFYVKEIHDRECNSSSSTDICCTNDEIFHLQNNIIYLQCANIEFLSVYLRSLIHINIHCLTLCHTV